MQTFIRHFQLRVEKNDGVSVAAGGIAGCSENAFPFHAGEQGKSAEMSSISKGNIMLASNPEKKSEKKEHLIFHSRRIIVSVNLVRE